MALNAGFLEALIDTKLAVNPAYSGWDQRTTFKEQVIAAIAEAVVEHIVAAAQVNVTVTSVSGVTTGAGTSGPGTGTGTIV